MSTPEFGPKEPLVELRPEQIDASQLRELGVTAVPAQPIRVKGDDGSVVAQSVPADAGQTIAVPVDSTTAATLSKGNVSNASTWFGRVVLRAIKKALVAGIRVIVRKKND